MFAMCTILSQPGAECLAHMCTQQVSVNGWVTAVQRPKRKCYFTQNAFVHHSLLFPHFLSIFLKYLPSTLMGVFSAYILCSCTDKDSWAWIPNKQWHTDVFSTRWSTAPPPQEDRVHGHLRAGPRFFSRKRLALLICLDWYNFKILEFCFIKSGQFKFGSKNFTR